MKTIHFDYAREAEQNPYIGFTSFQHFGTEILYSDLVVKPENNMTETEHVECYPIPDYVEENGASQGYYPACSVVYIRILWKEFEPEKGQFNLYLIEDILQKAKNKGQTVMFRLMPHSTRESDDVPAWVKTLIDCPPRPLGKREKISPRSPMFLELFGNAIRVLGEHFDKDPAFAFVDISLPGAWGEGSSCRLFSKELICRFVDIYKDVFQNTLLIGQMSEPQYIHAIADECPVGGRADCIGHPKLMSEYMPGYIEPIKELWKTGHISFESYWWLGEWMRKEWDIDSIIRLTLSWHISTFNAKSLPIPNEWKDKIDGWLDKMGYHFVIRRISFQEELKAGDTLTLGLDIDNVGVAPIYHGIPLYIKLKNNEREYILDTKVDIRKWIDGSYHEDIVLSLPADIATGSYSLELGIGGGDYPPVLFATNAPADGHFAIVDTITVK